MFDELLQDFHGWLLRGVACASSYRRVAAGRNQKIAVGVGYI